MPAASERLAQNEALSLQLSTSAKQRGITAQIIKDRGNAKGLRHEASAVLVSVIAICAAQLVFLTKWSKAAWQQLAFLVVGVDRGSRESNGDQFAQSFLELPRACTDRYLLLQFASLVVQQR